MHSDLRRNAQTEDTIHHIQISNLAKAHSVTILSRSLCYSSWTLLANTKFWCSHTNRSGDDNNAGFKLATASSYLKENTTHHHYKYQEVDITQSFCSYVKVSLKLSQLNENWNGPTVIPKSPILNFMKIRSAALNIIRVRTNWFNTQSVGMRIFLSGYFYSTSGDGNSLFNEKRG